MLIGQWRWDRQLVGEARAFAPSDPITLPPELVSAAEADVLTPASRVEFSVTLDRRETQRRREDR